MRKCGTDYAWITSTSRIKPHFLRGTDYAWITFLKHRPIHNTGPIMRTKIGEEMVLVSALVSSDPALPPDTPLVRPSVV